MRTYQHFSFYLPPPLLTPPPPPSFSPPPLPPLPPHPPILPPLPPPPHPHLFLWGLNSSPCILGKCFTTERLILRKQSED